MTVSTSCRRYLLWLGGGLLGLHHYYLGNVATGVVWTVTLGLGGLGACIDGCLIPRYTAEARDSPLWAPWARTRRCGLVECGGEGIERRSLAHRNERLVGKPI